MRKLVSVFTLMFLTTSSYAITADELKELIDRNALNLVAEKL